MDDVYILTCIILEILSAENLDISDVLLRISDDITAAASAMTAADIFILGTIDLLVDTTDLIPL